VPELPEVETVVRDLQPHLRGRRIAAVERITTHALRRPWNAAWSQELRGRGINAVRRRGKWIVLELEGESFLVFHLGMTGQLTVVPSGVPLASHTHLVFHLKGESHQLRFRDPRRFGSVTLFPTRAALEQFFDAAGLGPEPFDLPADYWRERLAATNRALKAVLLDQRVVAGVGNIYADESLFQAKLHPARLGRDLDAKAAHRLRRAVAEVLTRAIERRGSSIRDYVGGRGEKGGYQKEFRVYGRTGEPCPRCKTPIECIRLAGRSTHFCPRCQKESRH
jgi:formamidopyrimidine-DNA glycosylase